jgi:hypothetical protein
VETTPRTDVAGFLEGYAEALVAGDTSYRYLLRDSDGGELVQVVVDTTARR